MNHNKFEGGVPISLSNCSNLIAIHLGYNNLTRRIPEELGSLSKLVVLHLNDNNITGELLPSLGNLSFLMSFSVTYNNMSGSIPSSFGQLKSLQILALSFNMFLSKLPPSIYNLSSLTILSISGNQIYGSLPPNIGFTLPNLQMFLIGGNQFFGAIPNSLFNCSKLQKIDVSQNDFTGQVPDSVGSLENLQWLNLRKNRLGSGQTDDLKFVSSVINRSTLQILDIDSNKFGGTLDIPIVNFSSQLHTFILGYNQISGSIPSGIENLANLIALDITENQITGSIPIGIGKLRNLQYLGLGYNYLSGEIPSFVGNLSQLLKLFLTNNNFEGGITTSLSNCQSLQNLDLSGNKLNGTIPNQLFGSSSQLLFLFLNDNALSGFLSIDVGNLKHLVILDVSNNKLTGEIPSTLGTSLSLEQLNLTGNCFHGLIPPSFSSLKGLQLLDLSMNNLYGPIPMFLQNMPLIYLNLSFNNLEGEVPTKGVFRNMDDFSILGNYKLCGGIQQLQLLPCPKAKSKRPKRFPTLKVSLGVTLFVIVFASFLSLFLYRRRRPTKKPTSKHFWEDHFKRVSYQELFRATNGFSPTNLIGKGSFGAVYKGVIHEDEGPVAVKVLNLVERGASKSFMAECEALRKVRHRNLLKILTTCSGVDFQGNDFKALIFKFMPNGSLDDWLHANSDGRFILGNLSLPQRINIAIDIASALDYLHNQYETPIIHRDLKPSNVILDEEMVAHLNDFGLAKFLSKNTGDSDKDTSSIPTKGTIGYIPPEYGMGVEASTQGDVYSYGVLLLEMITGKRPTDKMFEDGRDLHHFSLMSLPEQIMKIVDPHMLSGEVNLISLCRSEIQRDMRDKVQQCLTSMVRIGVACSVKSPGERLDVKDALKELLSMKDLYFQTMINEQRENDANQS